MNIVTLTGRTVKDIELRYTPNGKAVASGTIAVQRKFKNANGEYESDFINFTAWGKTGELMANYIKKGDRFGISGQLTTRNYENSEGRKVYVTEVNVSDFDFPVKNKSQEENKRNTDDSRKPRHDSNNQDPFASGQPMDIDDMDSLPF